MTSIKQDLLIWNLKTRAQGQKEDVFEAETGKFRKVFFFFFLAEWMGPNSGTVASCFSCRPEGLILNVFKSTDPSSRWFNREGGLQ